MSTVAANTQAFTAFSDRNKDFALPSIGNRVWFCDPQDVVFQTRFMDAKSLFQFNYIDPAEGYSWLNGENQPQAALVTQAVLAPVSTGVDCFSHAVYPQATLLVDHPEYFHRGMVLRICNPAAVQPAAGTQQASNTYHPEEYVWVMDRDTSNLTLTVQRGWAGTPVAAIAANTKICVMYTAAEECSPHVTSFITGMTRSKNYLQLFKAGWSKTRMSELKQHYGFKNATDQYELLRTQLMGGTVGEGKNKMRLSGQLPKQLDQALLYGMGLQGGPDGGSAMGGINWFGIPQYNLAMPDYTSLRSIFRQIWNEGGMVSTGSYLMVISADAQEFIDDWADTRNQYRNADDNTYGSTIRRIRSSFGDIEFTMSRALRRNEMYILDLSKIGMLTIWDWQEEKLVNPETNLCENYEIYGLFGLSLACPCHHAKVLLTGNCWGTDCCPDDTCMPRSTVPQICVPGVV